MFIPDIDVDVFRVRGKYFVSIADKEGGIIVCRQITRETRDKLRDCGVKISVDDQSSLEEVG